jgi:glucokinase
MNKNIVVGTDIGGSHITAALVDLEDHNIIPNSLVRRHVDAKGNCDQILNEWSEAINECKSQSPEITEKIGIAMPGPFDYQKGISYIQGLDKFESLYNLNVKALLAEKLNIYSTSIFMMNDASCFLKGEVFGGAAKGSENAIGITLGTGLGSAAFKDGVIHDGDLFYMPYKEATAEDYVSTRWFIKEYKERTGISVTNVKEIYERASSCETAVSLFREFGINLGEVLASYSKKWDADTIVIGGNIINAWDLFMPQTVPVLKSHSIMISPMKAMLGEEAALLGAGSLCT